jgi:hypothetical protein
VFQLVLEMIRQVLGARTWTLTYSCHCLNFRGDRSLAPILLHVKPKLAPVTPKLTPINWLNSWHGLCSIPKATGKASGSNDRNPRGIIDSTSDIYLSRCIWGKPFNQKK